CGRQLHSGKSETKSSQGQQRAVTQREQEILRWLHLGKTNWEIARILDISPMTVKNHLQNIFRKLNVQTRDQAVHKASDIGLLSADRARAMERQI
ncbi:MAG TPA: LuxR C-terminal-related transcriptional regulator, partial [Methylophilaceae bacterium]|nr:LuxR C-terminal-related transcriptional regulator [Methylophilaceae bacterium]